jgi:hypothetical protein
MTTRTVLLGQDNRNGTTVQDSRDRICGTSQSGHRADRLAWTEQSMTAKTGQRRQEICEQCFLGRTAGTGQLGQHNKDSKTWTGQPEKDRQDRTARTELPVRLPEQDS